MNVHAKISAALLASTILSGAAPAFAQDKKAPPAAEKKAIDSANPNPGENTQPKSPYAGVQYAAIPEFQAIGLAVGLVLALLAGLATAPAHAELRKFDPSFRTDGVNSIAPGGGRG